MANSRSALSRASTSSSSCFGSSGPTSSCRSRCSTRRMLVSGVFSSWLTVATMLLFTSSKRRNRVTSSSSTAAPKRGRRGIANRQDPRQIGMGLLPVLQDDDLVEAFGHVRALFVQGLGQGLPQGLRRLPDRRRRAGMLRVRQAEEAAGGRIGHLHAALRIDHQHRLGKGVDRGLARPLGADQLGLVRLAEFAELAGHRVEGRGKLPQLVVGSDRHDLVEIAGPDGHGRFRRRADRIDDHANRVGHEKHRQHDAARQAQAVPDQRGAGQALRLVVDILHVLLVQPEDVAGNGLDLLKQSRTAPCPCLAPCLSLPK